MNGPQDTSINISSGTVIRIILFLILFALLFYLRDLVLIILTAIVLASAVEPAIVWLGKRRLSRLSSVIVIYLLAAIILVGGFYFFVPPLLDDVIDFFNRLPEQFATIEFFELGEGTVFTSNLQEFAESPSLTEAFRNFRDAISGVSGGVISATSAIFGGATSLLLIIVLSFYFAVQETGIDDFLRLITPVKKQDYVVSLWRRAQLKIGLWMQGQLILGLIVGVLVYLGLLLLGIPNALFLALLAAVFELIPIFGPILAAIPAVIVALLAKGSFFMFATIGLYLIIQQFENHLIYPLVVRKVVGLPPVLVIIALIAGAKLAGFLGIILSVPISAALKELVDDIQKTKANQKKTLTES